ncbi:CACTA en-spm transposon protein [Cucumis melo var. makuwa]|uniref:CACTA en-spm transposon protein n=1 Tax=Cucumis melo var. makuwa TaxID=1194695 RepID=A0A5A7VJI2_CUCMM|nr:CACTA en-spm transposon protein [Cucumis melo var. makuwa]TYK24050.1 CACTA en-spm transposon protein [Cucumis melo var. makuwa]
MKKGEREIVVVAAVPLAVEKETEEGHLEDEMSRNIGIDIDKDTTNIFKDILNKALNELFIEHQMLNTFKEFWGDCHRHFKSDPDEARANPPHILVEHDEDWHYLCDHYTSHEQSRANKTTKQKQPYKHSSMSKFFYNNTSLLSKEGRRSTVWGYFKKHTFGMGRSCRRPWRPCELSKEHFCP